MPSNNSLVDLNEFSKKENCRFSLIAENAFFHSVFIDSRIVEKNSLFVALKGEKADGHDFILSALEKGASAVFVQDSFAQENLSLCKEWLKKFNASFLSFEQPLLALQRLAATYVKKFPNLKKIAVTGSSGKTTTKEMIGSILSQKYPVVMNEGNFNSETGLPLSVFKIREEHQVGIFEMGMNRRDEIAELADVLFPQIGVVVNVGTAHIGLLGSEKNIATEKRQIFKNFSAQDVAIIEEDSKWKDFLCEGLSQVHFFGEKALKITDFSNLGVKGCEFNVGGKITLPLPGYHNFKNALAAITAARLFDKITFDDIKKGLEDLKPIFGRSQIFEKEGISVINDAYNANPSSMDAALDFTRDCSVSGRKFFVLGDMLELGEKSRDFHRQIAEKLHDGTDNDCFILVGEEFNCAAKSIAEKDNRFLLVKTGEEAEKIVKDKVSAGDLVIFKGSNGIGLWKTAQNIFGDGN